VALAGNLAAEQRLDWLRGQLQAKGRIELRVAAELLEVSEMTIRRDLLELEAVGVARRVRGGAVAAGPAQFADRYRQRAKSKARIAAKLLAIVPESGAVAFDASSTVLRLATALEGARDLTIVTNGPETFDALQGKPGVRAVLTGGELDPRTGSLVGPVAVRAAATFLLSHAFVSAAAVDPVIGASEAALEEAEVKQVFANVAGKVVLAADSSKLDSRALAVGLQWDEVGYLITDLEPDVARLARYRDVTEVI
jgi:DeoR family fructose operon transcriptional repressor